MTFLVIAAVFAAANRGFDNQTQSAFDLDCKIQGEPIENSARLADSPVLQQESWQSPERLDTIPITPLAEYSTVEQDIAVSPTTNYQANSFTDLDAFEAVPEFTSSEVVPLPPLNDPESNAARQAAFNEVAAPESGVPESDVPAMNVADMIPSEEDLENSYVVPANANGFVDESIFVTEEDNESSQSVDKGFNETISDNGSDFRGLESEGVEGDEAGDDQSPRLASRTNTANAKKAKGDKKKLPTPGGKSSKSGSKKKVPAVLSGLDEFKLAAQPELGGHFKDDRPFTTARGTLLPAQTGHFAPDPNYNGLGYDPYGYMEVYEGKTLNANQRPLLELGRPFYQLGQLSPGSSILGFHNNVVPQLVVFGDNRIAFASNRQNGGSSTQIATALNLDIDLKITSTERFHAFISPNSGGGGATRWLMDDNEFISEADANFDTAFFEGDLGAIVGGMMHKTLPFDLPFAVGVMPLLFQNGVWMNDAVLGAAVTIPARNSARFDISNMDITFFAAYDKIVSDAFPGDNSAARMYGVASFIEAMNGYWEIDYAFLDDRTFDNRSYHNIGIGFTRRYGRFLSNSMRVIVNAGQATNVVENTADGVLLLSENSLITGAPSTVVPYMNFFAGFDRPQSAARAGAAGGVLNNTGILFESDNLTGYPTLDASANDTFGMAMGLNLLASDFSQQLVVEAAMLGVMGDDANRKAQGDQYGLGVRYQLPLTNSIIFRTDAMIGFLRGDEDVNGVRMELRKKF